MQRSRANMVCDVCICDNNWDSSTAAPADPYDLLWVKKWAAIGDSYAAGIGSGSLYPNSSTACARYDQSYPAFIQDNDLMPQNPAATFEYLACSGATSPEILSSQVSEMGTGYDLITVSAGGNDVGLSDILNACVFQWNPFRNCEDEMQNTLNLIRDTLPGNLDKLYTGLADKINTGRKIYVTGYATFFDNSTTGCDNTTWSFWFNTQNKQMLTTERRTLMNELTVATNTAIEAAVKRAGDSFEFVGYDQYFEVLQGRFCEAGVQEPEGDRDGLLFFQWTSSSNASTLLPRGMDESELFAADPMVARMMSGPETMGHEAVQRRQDQADSSSGGSSAPGVNETFQGSIESYIAEAQAQNSSLVISLADGSAADPAFRGRTSLSVSDLVSDSIKRVFHPKPAGHAVIANLVLWRMIEDNAALVKATAIAPSEASGCDVPSEATRPDVPTSIPGVNTNCQSTALKCLDCLGSASGFGIFACTFNYRSECNACGGGDGCPC
ncbi:putative esterase family protein [Diaporthe ampelina]|uniref:Putative esterase family protein n=1 Tax=Diaporthe ampelina TaxID=1214573 RepID=A0A0G2FX94_9PEZI|nr:putative esterase family protein [Diaporthe ampelina]